MGRGGASARSEKNPAPLKFRPAKALASALTAAGGTGERSPRRDQGCGVGQGIGRPGGGRVFPPPAGHIEALFLRPILARGGGFGRLSPGGVDSGTHGTGRGPAPTGNGVQGRPGEALRSGAPVPAIEIGALCLLPGFPPVLPIIEEPVQASFHPPAHTIQTGTSSGTRTLSPTDRRPCPRTGARDPIHQLSPPAHPGFQPIFQTFPAGACVSPRVSTTLSPGLAPGLPARGALRRQAPVVIHPIHAGTLARTLAQPTLPSQAQQGDGTTAPLQGPEKGGQPALATDGP
jgi:hypothetical protein